MNTVPPHDQNDNPSLKYCPKCPENDCWHPATLEYFHRNRTSEDKLNRLCKKCNIAHSAKYKQEKRKNRPPKPVPTHCKHGHLLTEENIRMHHGRRECGVCHRIKGRKNGSTDPGYLDRKRQRDYCLHGHPLVEGNLRTGKHAGACLTCHRESGRRRYHENPEKLIAQSSDYAKSHRPQINTRWRGYRQQEAFQEREKASRMRRQDRKKVQAINLSSLTCLDDHEQGILHFDMLYDDPCCYCGGPMEHVDHIVSVVKDGSEHWTNLTASCRRCNQRKQDRSLLEFLLYRLEYPDKEKNAS